MSSENRNTAWAYHGNAVASPMPCGQTSHRQVEAAVTRTLVQPPRESWCFLSVPMCPGPGPAHCMCPRHFIRARTLRGGLSFPFCSGRLRVRVVVICSRSQHGPVSDGTGFASDAGGGFHEFSNESMARKPMNLRAATSSFIPPPNQIIE